ncbi:MAG: TIGR00730 family Rossman fold protein [Pseudomonadota bacterium]
MSEAWSNLAKSMKSLCIYCGSRTGQDPAFREAAVALGQETARRGCRIVYGGGKLGLMGATASAARDAGGAVFGIIPDFLVELEGVLDGVEHVIVNSMHERKMQMFEESDAIVTLPGGIGTLEEIIEVLSWAQLNIHNKPIIVLNIKEFWTPLKSLFEHLVEMDFAAPQLLSNVQFVDTIDAVFEAAEGCAIRDRV